MADDSVSIDRLPPAAPVPAAPASVGDPEDILVAKDIAAHQRISVRAAQDVIRGIKGAYQIGRLWRVRRREYAAWLKRKAEGGA